MGDRSEGVEERGRFAPDLRHIVGIGEHLAHSATSAVETSIARQAPRCSG